MHYNKIIISTILLLAIFGVNSKINNFELPEKHSYEHIFIDGEYVGVVDSENNIDQVIKNSVTYSTDVDNRVVDEMHTNVLVVEQKTNIDFNTENEQIAQEVAQSIAFVEPGYSLYVDNKLVAYIENKDSFERVSEMIASNYIDDVVAFEEYKRDGSFTPIERNNQTLTSFRINNEIKVTNEYVSSNKVIKSDEELKYVLLHGDKPVEIYTVKKGDDFTSIAEKSNISKEVLMLNNFNINSSTLLFEGQELIVNELNPVVDIVTTTTISAQESIPFSTVYRDDSSLDAGREVLLMGGIDGKAFVTNETTYINGKPVDTQTVANELISSPQDKIVARGTKEATQTVAKLLTTPQQASGK